MIQTFTCKTDVGADDNIDNTENSAHTTKKRLPKWAKILIVIVLISAAVFGLLVLAAVCILIAAGNGIADGFNSVLSELAGDIFGGIIKEGASLAAENAGEKISECISNIIQ